MSAQPQSRLTPEQYLEIERASEFRNEYYDGRMYAKPGGNHAHAIAIGNLACEIGNAVRKRRCRVTPIDLRGRAWRCRRFTTTSPSAASKHLRGRLPGVELSRAPRVPLSHAQA